MSRVEIRLPDNPAFVSVTGLTNTTFDAASVVPGRGATEGQLKSVGDRVTELETVVAAFDPGDNIYQGLVDRLDTLETLQEQCCAGKLSQENVEAMLQNISDRLDTLEAMIEDCCNRSCFGEGGTAAGGDNVITVTFEWNGVNKVTAGGTATATSEDTSRSIVGYWFLARDPNTGLYFRSSTANGGAFTWRIDSSGNVTAASAGASAAAPFANSIVAADDAGNEGAVGVSLPYTTNVGA